MEEHKPTNIIGDLVDEYRELAAFLESSGEITLKVNVDMAFAKTLVISAASYFEAWLTDSLVDLYSERTNSEVLVQFVRNLAIERRYFQWFDWRSNNANRFFGTFGGNFRALMDDKVRNDEGLRDSIRAFLELENLRNNLVHGNYAAYQLDRSVDDVLNLYENAIKFVEGFPAEIRAYMDQQNQGNEP